MSLDRTLHAWDVAAADAHLDPASVNLWPIDAPAETGGFGAVSFVAGQWALPGDTAFPLTAAQRSELYERRDESFILVSARHDERVLPLLLRHEAEHIVQALAAEATSEMGARLAYAASRIEDSGFLYFALPHERDADSAATRLVGRLGLHPTEAEQIGGDRMLFTAPWPDPDPSTVAVRQFAFSLLMPDEFRFACENAPTIESEELLNALIADGHARWAARRADHRDVIRDALDHGVDLEQFGRMSRPEQLRFADDLRARIVAAESAIVVDVERDGRPPAER